MTDFHLSITTDYAGHFMVVTEIKQSWSGFQQLCVSVPSL
ncbi:MAG: hypothetical protein MAG581_01179 [Deltaproteobacteria bacterium]|nr:hypothetical protein [Deltaproteobacteria bacterium]